MLAKFKLRLARGLGYIAGATLFVAFSYAVAQSIQTFRGGDAFTAASINTMFQASAPEGAIQAFYLAACPDGWVAADGNNSTPRLRGMFLRGLNDFGTGARADGNQDPNGGARTLGDYQADAFQGHYHDATGIDDFYGNRPGGLATALPPGSNNAGSEPTTGAPITDGTNGTPRTTSETRVKNVALIFCMRKDL